MWLILTIATLTPIVPICVTDLDATVNLGRLEMVLHVLMLMNVQLELIIVDQMPVAQTLTCHSNATVTPDTLAMESHVPM